MMALIIVIHVLACALLIVIILIQRGRGGGLVESFSGVESMFGTKTDAFLTRSTTVLSILFFITCLSLAFLSARQSRSLMKDIKESPKVTEERATETQIPAATEKPIEQATAPAQIPEAPKTEPRPSSGQNNIQ